MARHKQYLRNARLSRRTASAAFDSRFSFSDPTVAKDAAYFLWEELQVKARVVGNDVIYETPLDPQLLDAVEAILEDLQTLGEVDEDDMSSMYGPGTAKTWTDEDGDWEAVDDLHDVEDDDEGEEWKRGAVADFDVGDEVRVPFKNKWYYGVVDRFLVDDRVIIKADDGSTLNVLVSDVELLSDLEPEIEEPGDDYRPTRKRMTDSEWRPRGSWVDLVIDYSQLPNEDALLKYAKRAFAGFEGDDVLDVAAAREGDEDFDGQKEFIAALLYLQHHHFDQVDMWWDHLRAYRYSQENKGAGLSRFMRRVKMHGPAAEASRRSLPRKK